MSTYMPKAGDITRKWYVIDAAGKPLGKVAVQAAVLLRGKHKPTFAPHADCGDHVIIINAEKAVLTGNQAQPEDVLSSHRLYRQHERGQVQHPHEDKARVRCRACSQGYAARQYSGPHRSDQTPRLQRRRAQARSTEARRVGSLMKGGN